MPCAPSSLPGGWSTGCQRLFGRPGSTRSPVCCESKPVRARYRSRTGRGELLGHDRPGRGRADPVLLAVGVIGREDDPLGGDLGLVDRRDRLRVARQPGQHPGELGRVDGRHLHDGDPYLGPLVQQLAPDRLGEPVDGVLGAAVGGLQRDRPVAEGGADLDDRAAVPWPHPRKRDHRAVHEPQVADLGDPPELIRLDLPERREDRGERHVHPDVDRAEPVLRLLGRPLDGVEVGHVGRDGQRAAARALHRVGRRREAVLAPRDQHHVRAATPEELGRGPPDSGARTGDHYCLGHVPALLLRLGDAFVPVTSSSRLRRPPYFLAWTGPNKEVAQDAIRRQHRQGQDRQRKRPAVRQRRERRRQDRHQAQRGGGATCPRRACCASTRWSPTASAVP